MKQLEQKYIDSREVAEMVGKEHKDLLRDLRRYIDQFNQRNLAPVDFFQEGTYRDDKGQARPCYQITQKGCEFIAHKLTGIKGTEFTAKYINRFHEMEEQIRKPRTTMELLEMEFAALKEVDSKVDAVTKDLQDLKSSLPLLPADADEVKNEVNKKAIACLCGKGSNAYKDRSLCQKVYSDIYRELKRQFDVSQYKYIRRSQKHLAIQIVRDYQMPFVLAEEVKDANAQLNLEEGADGV